MDNKKNIRIAGAGRIDGGTYAEVSTAGSARFTGPVVCDSIHAAGSTTFESDVTTGSCSASGSCHFCGALTAAELSLSGSGRVFGDLSVSGTAKLSGSVRVNGSVKAQSLVISGSATLEKGVECESFSASGGFTVGGLLNAETVSVKLGGNCKADEIGGSAISVKRPVNSQLNLFGLTINLNAGTGLLTANLIEASSISLENTVAKVVCGETVEIGPGCEIERVEYSGSLIVADDANVGEQVKVD